MRARGGSGNKKRHLTPRAQSSQRREKRKKRRNINAEGTPARPGQAPSTEFTEKRRTSLRTGQRESLWGLGGFGRIELHGTEDAFAFFDEDHLVGLDVAERLDEAAGPADFQEFDVLGFADAEMDAQIILRKIAAAAAHFVYLRMEALFAREVRDAFYARADAAAIRFGADGFDFDPIVARTRVATQKLRVIVDGVDHHVEVAVIVKVAEGAAARRDRGGDSRSSVVGNVFETAVAEILVEKLALRIAGFGLELLDFGIDVAIAKQNIGPAVVVHIEKAAAPAEIKSVLAEAGLE